MRSDPTQTGTRKLNPKTVLKILKGKNFDEQSDLLYENGAHLNPYQLEKAQAMLSKKNRT